MEANSSRSKTELAVQSMLKEASENASTGNTWLTLSNGWLSNGSTLTVLSPSLKDVEYCDRKPLWEACLNSLNKYLPDALSIVTLDLRPIIGGICIVTDFISN